MYAEIQKIFPIGPGGPWPGVGESGEGYKWRSNSNPRYKVYFNLERLKLVPCERLTKTHKPQILKNQNANYNWTKQASTQAKDQINFKCSTSIPTKTIIHIITVNKIIQDNTKTN